MLCHLLASQCLMVHFNWEAVASGNFPLLATVRCLLMVGLARTAVTVSSQQFDDSHKTSLCSAPGVFRSTSRTLEQALPRVTVTGAGEIHEDSLLSLDIGILLSVWGKTSPEDMQVGAREYAACSVALLLDKSDTDLLSQSDKVVLIPFPPPSCVFHLTNGGDWMLCPTAKQWLLTANTPHSVHWLSPRLGLITVCRTLFQVLLRNRNWTHASTLLLLGQNTMNILKTNLSVCHFYTCLQQLFRNFKLAA